MKTTFVQKTEEGKILFQSPNSLVDITDAFDFFVRWKWGEWLVYATYAGRWFNYKKIIGRYNYSSDATDALSQIRMYL